MVRRDGHRQACVAPAMFVVRNHETRCFSLAEREITVLVVFALKPPPGALSCPKRIRRIARCRVGANDVE
jgi:hypothetical protein